MTVSSRQSRTPLDFLKKLIRCLQWFLMWFDSTCRYTQNILDNKKEGTPSYTISIYVSSLLGGLLAI